MKRNELFDKCVANCDPATMAEVNRKEALEEEYQEFCKDYPFPWSSQYVNQEYIDELCLSIASHFAEWGEKNAYKAIMKKADEVRDKRFDTDYEVKFEPSAGFDLGCVNVYHEGKLVGQYVEPKEEKEQPSEDLEKAAKRIAYDVCSDLPRGEQKDTIVYYAILAAIAGANLQKEQMMKGAVEWLKAHANDYIVDLTPTYPEAPVNIIVGGKCWEDFKKAMED